MRMVRACITMLAALLLLPLAGRVEAQQDTTGAGRARLERQVLRQFVERTAQQTGMTAEQRTRIEAVLRASAERHRERMMAGVRLRRELAAAIGDARTGDAEFTRLLAQIERLRAQEQDAWRQDQRAIAGVLTPRQRAVFTVRWMEFQERVRGAMGRGARRGMGPPR